MIVKKANEPLLSAMRERIKAQRELIDALQTRLRFFDDQGLFPCGCRWPGECVHEGGGGLLAYGVRCKRSAEFARQVLGPGQGQATIRPATKLW